MVFCENSAAIQGQSGALWLIKWLTLAEGAWCGNERESIKKRNITELYQVRAASGQKIYN